MKRDNNNSMSSSPFFTSKNSSNNNEKPNTKFSFNNNNKKIFVNNADIDHDKDFGSDRFVVNDGFVKMQVHSKNTNDKQIFAFESLNKKERFEQFLTYRKRLSRLALVQSCYLYEIQFLTANENFQDHVSSIHINKNIKTEDVIKSVIFLYRNVFFYGRYGPINKKKKLEEKWLYDSLTDIIKYINELDDKIKQKLTSKWTIYKLDPTIRAILRCAMYEMLYNPAVTKKIVVSEYVKLSTAFYEDPKVFGFINGLLDSIGKMLEGK